MIKMNFKNHPFLKKVILQGFADFRPFHSFEEEYILKIIVNKNFMNSLSTGRELLKIKVKPKCLGT